ncbi:hypothetical protein M9458_003872, partial [Cirrhinus mrigala]
LEDPMSLPPASESRTPPRPFDPVAPRSLLSTVAHQSTISAWLPRLSSTVCRLVTPLLQPPWFCVARAPPRPSGSPPLPRSPEPSALPWPSGSSASPWLVGSLSPTWAPPPPDPPLSVGPLELALLHYGSSLCRLHRGPPSWLWPGSCLASLAPSYFLPGSSLCRIHPGFVLSSSSQVSVLCWNLHGSCLPAILLALCCALSSSLLHFLCPPPKSPSVPPFVVPAAQGRTFREGVNCQTYGPVLLCLHSPYV